MSYAVIKIGGALLGDEARMDSFWRQVQRLAETLAVIVVHGGGPQATAMARTLGHEPTMIEGRRVTSDLDLSIMHWALCGELNTQLVSQASAIGLPAVGIKGIDGQTVQVRKRPPWTIAGKEVDFGWVGDVETINTDLLQLLLTNNYLPVITPLGIDQQGQTYNVNADTIAQSIASALGAQLFCMVAESGGVRRVAEEASSHLTTMDAGTYSQGKTEGWIQGGMIVKLKVAFDALRSGVPEVYICTPEDVFERLSGTRII
ncbi:MAG: acetylglutamate kinase [Rhodothermaceae bacterium]|nr:acetylglutamate kinase [Rhodothermaceae bacterium]